MALAITLLIDPGLAAAAGSPVTVRAADFDPLASRVDLRQLFLLAGAHSPAIRSARHRWKASTRKARQVESLPDPMVEWRDYTRRMTPVDERWVLGASQMMPLWPKRRAAGRVARSEADAELVRYEVTVRDTLADLKDTFFELYYIDRARRVTGEVEALYRRYATLAAAGPEAATTTLPELFRAESQRVQLGNDQILLEQMRAARCARLRALLGAPGDLVFGETGEVKDPPGGLPFLEKLQEIARLHSQDLKAAGIELKAARARRDVARVAPLPDLTLGAMYMRTGGQDEPDGDPTKDPILVTVASTVPIWQGKYKAQRREARDLERAAQAGLDARALQVESELSELYFRLTTSHRLVRLYRDTLLPQARQALASAMELTRNGRATLASLLELTGTVHNFELALLRARADFYQNMARLEKILGTSFPLEANAP